MFIVQVPLPNPTFSHNIRFMAQNLRKSTFCKSPESYRPPCPPPPQPSKLNGMSNPAVDQLNLAKEYIIKTMNSYTPTMNSYTPTTGFFSPKIDIN